MRGTIFGLICLTCASILMMGGCDQNSPPDGTTKRQAVSAPANAITFKQSSDAVAAYDFVEVTLEAAHPIANPFVTADVIGEFTRDYGQASTVHGFCDSDDGRVYRIRFMPTEPGDYRWSVQFHHGDDHQSFQGAFKATDQHRRGLLRVDGDHPWHFIWQGTGEHYFYNGTTAFLLMQWKTEQTIDAILDRFARLKCNRVRVLLNGRPGKAFAGEPVILGGDFSVPVNPWPARHPDDQNYPQFDYSRFNLPHWRRFERMLRHAREKDVIISVVLDWDDTREHPAPLSEDERRYYRYAAARLAAFSNVTWDLGDDLSAFRSLKWAHEMGTYLYQFDPYHHLATDHPLPGAPEDRTGQWYGFTSYQEWSRPQHAWLLKQRQIQQKTGRIIPQTNEEYGYEDHYPRWANYGPPVASTDAMRRIAWEIAMAGCYQTAGETARHGTNYWPDTGGGWWNGRGDDSMILLAENAHALEFFTHFEWWKADPHDELVTNGAFCLAEPGKIYAVYLPHGGNTTLTLVPGPYHVQSMDPRTGEVTQLEKADGPTWTSPTQPDEEDWAFLLTRTDAQ